MTAPFAGFVAGGPATTLPAQFFVEVLPEIEDEAELRVTLYALYAIQRQRGWLRAVRGGELACEAPLLRALASCGGAAALGPALARAVARGTLLACPLEDGDALYFANGEAGRRAAARMRSSGLVAPAAARLAPAPESAPRSHAVAVYEAEIGALTPALAESLAAALERYPEDWIIDALELAARRNARSWRYAEAVLRRWQAEGRDDATAQRPAGGGAAPDPPDGGAPRDPYAGVVRREWP